MIGKSRRSKRKTTNSDSGKSPTMPPSANIVPISTRRKRRPRPPQNTAANPTQAPRTPQKTAANPRQVPRLTTKSPLNPRRNPQDRPEPRSSTRNNRRFRLKLPKPILYPLRFIIVGVGIGAFIGTILAISNSRPYITSTQKGVEQQKLEPNPAPVSTLPLKTPLVALTDFAKVAIAADDKLDATLLFVDLDSGEYLDVASSRPVSAASTIKIPILIAFFEAVDQGKVKLSDVLTLTETTKATGSGDMQYKPIGSTFSSLDAATEMSVHSDNTATNMIIEQLGGAGVLNAKFREWGMDQTQINAPLPDLDGTNMTSAKDLAYLLARVSQGDILSSRSRDRLFRIMGKTENDRLLPQSIGAEAEIVHKTGDIGTIIGDAGIIDMPNGKRYIASIFVERPYNSPAGKELLHKISRQFYEYLDKGVQPPAESPTTEEAKPSTKPPATGDIPPSSPPPTTEEVQPPNETGTGAAEPPAAEETQPQTETPTGASPATGTVPPPEI